MIELGIYAEDVISGFKGYITGRVTYITGCDQYLLSPRIDKDGKVADTRWVDENRIKPCKGKKKIVLPEAEKPIDNGPDTPAPMK
jgi:hypothetical protein